MVDSNMRCRYSLTIMLTVRQLKELRSMQVDEPNKLRKAMELAGVTQVQIAAAVGVTQPHVSDIANGKYTALPIETARRFSNFFGCTIDDLFPARQAVA